ncbi:Alpha/Beta hydrolase protein [Gamsiella multidivaricata]|uniref:Alpha/Beta hydrolase protein n=1 Tax=Gamsiella multidivaricata TaxID=101098 RepID=UPI00221F84D7|nr:Alpha/Beta hydrolase protein [Gamsiella multidivaricata]KAG0350828.1 hypothetical protein BGZ54_003618 [Gamsiella multidivaricata]KAI7828651.1 Alpha/Beta hydrolase protein [Gamsiella multidivaricata]
MPPEPREYKDDVLPRKPSSQKSAKSFPSSGPKAPTFSDRLYLAGVLHRPIDAAFLLGGLGSCVWTAVCMLVLDIPFLIWTRFSVNSERHPISWGPIFSFCMAMSRASSSAVYNVVQLRMVSNIISWFIPLRMLHLSNYKFDPNVRFKVHLDTLLIPERKTLFYTRRELGHNGGHRGKNPSNPSPEYLASFLPDEDKTGRIPNLPEESGPLDMDGTYTMKGEWIEALEDPTHLPNDDKEAKRSNVVVLYAHGGGHVFCSAKFHRQLVTRMLLEFGPGARAFVMEYRLAPEDPFPAAIHDAYAAYLYLTQPNHEAITLCRGGLRGAHHTTPVDPKDIVLAGDSAGAGVAIGLQLYLRDYVQPSVEPKPIVPPATVLISAWTDISTSMPSATSRHSYCYTPSPMGVNPFASQEKFYSFPKFNFARTYLCGDSDLFPNERNSGGKDLEWEWYRHLAQHPLVSPVYTANLSGLESSTLLQTGTFDRLVDDTRLYAHKLGQANPDERVRLELYRDMVHVHQFFEFLPMADKALKSMVAFVEDAQQRHKTRVSAKTRGSNGTEWIIVDTVGNETEGHNDDGCPIDVLETYWRPDLK